MTNIIMKKYERIITKHGVNKRIAKEIITTAWETSKGGRNFETYIEYAIKLTYGSNFKLKLAE